ncbi:MAG TPA: cellulase family glycosylhydrolase [Gemmatales bacterium]|nr:cellulase family glycosylhydrolase [Gemmatales bacterium]
MTCWRAVASSIVFLCTVSAQAQVIFTGTNLSGAEFGTNWPGTFGIDYTYPTNAEVDYFVGKGMNTFRLPVRWERLQQTQNGALNATELARLNNFVNYATSKGANVIIDPHNFARYYPPSGNYQSDPNTVIGSAAVPYSAFGDFWSKMATQYKSNNKVIFNLMNEPNAMTTESWVTASNTAITAIRNTGANNLIIVPGNGYTGAWTWSNNWYGTPNAMAMLNIVDSKNNFAFDVHQYMDNDGSGTTATITGNDPLTGVNRISELTQWLKTNHKRAFLGEFAVAASTIGTGPTQVGDEVLQSMLNYMKINGDVWMGWTWWSAGPWWPSDYLFYLDPADGVDKPQMAVLQPFFATTVPEPSTYAMVGLVVFGVGWVCYWRRGKEKQNAEAECDASGMA